MAVIRVPKTPTKAYDPQRPAGTLLQSQLRHLEWAVRPAGARAGTFTVKRARTEGEAARRIGKLNDELHRQATAPRDVVPPNPQPKAASPKRKTNVRRRARQKADTASATRRKSKRGNSR